MKTIRQPIIVLEGHVDHGKSSILDYIRGTSIVKAEAGAITQAIGASIVPLNTVKKICGPLLEALRIELTIPGLLLIDTPGHASFTSLRKRGGNLADIAIVVIDINEGLMPQTLEAIDILKRYKTPFIIAANKIDLISGWKVIRGNLLKVIEEQPDNVKTAFEGKLYELVGKLSEIGFDSDRFDRVSDYTKQIAIVPTSATTGIGIPELLMSLVGLTQKFLEQNLASNVEGFAKGTILEVKESSGLGKTLDIIIYDGHLKVNDTIVIGGINAPIVTKIKALLEPAPLSEMRDKKAKFKGVKEVFAATGVKISAPEIEEAVAGMPIRSCDADGIEETKEAVQKEVEEVLIETDKKGIVIKADTLGSLEALIKLLKEKNIEIKKASIGPITKKDINEAEANFEADPLISVVLGFNVSMSKEIVVSRVKVLSSNIIYKLMEDFEKWQENTRKAQESEKLSDLTRPCKMEIMKGYVFRQNNPAVFGVDILAGELKANVPLMKEDGTNVQRVKSMQLEQENVEKAEKGKQVAVSVDKITVGRQVNEGDILYSDITESEFRKLRELKDNLSKEEISILKEIAAIKRKENSMWGI